jgi:hypothetical protein
MSLSCFLPSRAKGGLIITHDVTSVNKADTQGAFNQITHTIEEKTKTDTHPGLVTQAQNAFQTGVHKVETFLDDVSHSGNWYSENRMSADKLETNYY